MLASVGVDSVAQLREADLFELYGAIKRRHAGASLNLLYALIGAVEGRDWREVARAERTSVLLRLDAMGLLGAPRGAARRPG
jgi:DNA transformation protein